MPATEVTYPAHIDTVSRETIELLETVAGWLSPREAAFLVQVAAMPTCQGESLELGSYRGKIAIALSRGSALADHAPLTTVAIENSSDLHANMKRADITDRVRPTARPSPAVINT